MQIRWEDFSAKLLTDRQTHNDEDISSSAEVTGAGDLRRSVLETVRFLVLDAAVVGVVAFVNGFAEVIGDDARVIQHAHLQPQYDIRYTQGT